MQETNRRRLRSACRWVYYRSSRVGNHRRSWRRAASHRRRRCSMVTAEAASAAGVRHSSGKARARSWPADGNDPAPIRPGFCPTSDCRALLPAPHQALSTCDEDVTF